MTNFFRFTSIAGLLAISGVASFAQTSELRADIPFAFATPNGGEMPAGHYMIGRMNQRSGLTVYRFLNVATHQSTIALASDAVKRSPGDKTYKPELKFRCAGDACAIAGIYRAGEQYGDGVRVHLKNVDPTMQIAEIAIPLGE